MPVLRCAACALLLSVSLAPAAAAPITLRVGTNAAADGLCELSSLQQAIDQVPVGETETSTLLVERGFSFDEARRGLRIAGGRRVRIVGGLAADCRDTATPDVTRMQPSSVASAPMLDVSGASTRVDVHRFALRGQTGGPVVAVSDFAELTLRDALVEDNGDAGAVAAPVQVRNGAQLVVDGGRISGNQSAGRGGAIRCETVPPRNEATQVHLRNDLVLVANRGDEGGAVSVGRGCLLRSEGDVLWSANRARLGGAIALQASLGPPAPNAAIAPSASLEEARFGENAADADGGAIYAGQHAFLQATRLQFSANSAQRGGALHLQAAEGGLVASSTFVDNRALAGGGAGGLGGAIYSERPLRFDASRCSTALAPDRHCAEFVGNHADVSGGAIHARAALGIDSAIFLGNQAAQRGSAIALQDAPLQLANALFSANDAPQAGGAALDLRGNATMLLGFSTFAFNAADAIRAGGGARLVLVGNIASDNRRGLVVEADATLAGSCNNVQLGDAAAPLDPRFVAPALGDFRLAAESPMRDLGASCDYARLPVSDLGPPDFDLVRRRRDAAPDAGAFEFVGEPVFGDGFE